MFFCKIILASLLRYYYLNYIIIFLAELKNSLNVISLFSIECLVLTF